MQQVPKGLLSVAEQLSDAENGLIMWLNAHVYASQKISKQILNLFKDSPKEKLLLTLSATLLGEQSGYIYSPIEDKFPKDLTLLECAILAGINLTKGPKESRKPSWCPIIVKMNYVKEIQKPGTNFKNECETIQKISMGSIVIKPYNSSNRTDLFVFLTFFDFEKELSFI